MTSAEAQAFKRACSCFGLGRYFNNFGEIWVDLDEYNQPRELPALPVWALPGGVTVPKNYCFIPEYVQFGYSGEYESDERVAPHYE